MQSRVTELEPFRRLSFTWGALRQEYERRLPV